MVLEIVWKMLNSNTAVFILIIGTICGMILCTVCMAYDQYTSGNSRTFTRPIGHIGWYGLVGLGCLWGVLLVLNIACRVVFTGKI